MSRTIRVQKGGVVPVRIPFREVRSDSLDGQRVDVNGVQIIFLNPDGTTQSTLATAWQERGIYVAYWDTSSLAVGDYRARIRFGYAFSTAQGGVTKTGERSVILRLVNSA